MTKTETKTTLIETRDVRGAYDMICRQAIIEHPTHGRLLLTEGYGGEDSLEGGAYRWRHGVLAKLQPGDTLAALEAAEWNPVLSHLGAVLEDCDPDRPVLAWDGHSLEAVARAAGL